MNDNDKRAAAIIVGICAIITGIWFGLVFFIHTINPNDDALGSGWLPFILTGVFVILYIKLKDSIFYLSSSTENSMFESKHKLKSNGELFDGFRKVEDEMTGNITYRHPKAPDGYNFYQLGLWMYVHFVSSSDSSFIPYLEIRYIYRGINSSDSFQQALWGDANWIFIDSIIFKTEKNLYNLDIKPKRDNNVLRDGNMSFSYFVELDVIPLGTIPYTKMFEDIAQSPVLKIRLCGKNKNVDLDLSNYKQRKYIVDAYNAYKKAKEIHHEKIKNPIS